ncbi:hypothetical protein BaRGS_00036087 [Batillaria attramentaria]|uniref:Uncharacterized protein n=1 Tax=Batillaria attramentaria TaxID=370345 RepID=A0ABD0JCT3_9CAEN
MICRLPSSSGPCRWLAPHFLSPEPRVSSAACPGSAPNSGVPDSTTTSCHQVRLTSNIFPVSSVLNPSFSLSTTEHTTARRLQRECRKTFSLQAGFIYAIFCLVHPGDLAYSSHESAAAGTEAMKWNIALHSPPHPLNLLQQDHPKPAEHASAVKATLP